MNSIIIACSGCGARNRVPAPKQHLAPRCGRCGSPLLLGRAAVPVELGDDTFFGFVDQASLPLLVDFFSPTCGPCQMLGPVIDTLARDFLGRAIIAKLDTSRNPATPGRFNIRGVPTLIFFRRGTVIDQVTGALPENVLRQRLEALITSRP